MTTFWQGELVSQGLHFLLSYRLAGALHVRSKYGKESGSSWHSGNVCLLFVLKAGFEVLLQRWTQKWGPQPECVTGRAKGGNGAFWRKSRGWESGSPSLTTSLPGTRTMLHLHRNLEMLTEFHWFSDSCFHISKIRTCLTNGVVRNQCVLVYLAAFYLF